MYNYYTEEEFEEKWSALLQHYKELDNPELQQLYDKRHSWAETFLRGIFILGRKITQHCEFMHSALKKKFLPATYPLREFVQEIDIMLSKQHHTELQCDYTSKHTSPQLSLFQIHSTLITKQVGDIYTRYMYYKIVEQISKENFYSIIDQENQGDCILYSFTKFQHGEIHFKLQFLPLNKEFKCTCMLFEIDCYPCRHIRAVMKQLDKKSFPKITNLRTIV